MIMYRFSEVEWPWLWRKGYFI